jgi:hypothetical protein
MVFDSADEQETKLIPPFSILVYPILLFFEKHHMFGAFAIMVNKRWN